MQPKITITVKLQVEGIHKFLYAEKIYPEVWYLSQPHRHTFHIACEFEVTHTERDKEFIITKNEIRKYLHDKYYAEMEQCLYFDKMSCESIALDLYNHFELESCEVGEDGEFSAKVTSKNIFNL